MCSVFCVCMCYVCLKTTLLFLCVQYDTPGKHSSGSSEQQKWCLVRLCVFRVVERCHATETKLIFIPLPCMQSLIVCNSLPQCSATASSPTTCSPAQQCALLVCCLEFQAQFGNTNRIRDPSRYIDREWEWIAQRMSSIYIVHTHTRKHAVHNNKCALAPERTKPIMLSDEKRHHNAPDSQQSIPVVALCRLYALQHHCYAL